VALGSALEALNVGELLAGVLGVVGVVLLGLAAVLAEEADLVVAGHFDGWLLVVEGSGKIPFISLVKRISIFCEIMPTCNGRKNGRNLARSKKIARAKNIAGSKSAKIELLLVVSIKSTLHIKHGMPCMLRE
jgi:hypothetical protein